MLNIVYGSDRPPDVTSQLVAELAEESGSLYLGYPLLPIAEKIIAVDALLISKEHGPVAFLFRDLMPDNSQHWEDIISLSDDVLVALENKLRQERALRHRNALQFDVKVITVFPMEPPLPPDNIDDLEEISFCSLERVKEILANCKPIPEHLLRQAEANLQAVSHLKSPKRQKATDVTNSRGNIIRQLEEQIAHLDLWQRKAAMETIDGPQRIRGLAGSGKTIVLALKATYLHIQNPDWIIAVTFYTRSLYQQFESLITKFAFAHNREPDWNRLRILHAWGGSNESGVYAEMAAAVRAPLRTFAYGKAIHGREQAFAGICTELLAIASHLPHEPLFDAILIDEAQDFPPAFFQLARQFTRDGKKVIWAYDELQRLDEEPMPSLEDIFGVTRTGEPVVRLSNEENQPRQDIMLNRCYRNPSEILSVAHALGLGLYREGGPIQGFDEPSTWKEIGYEVLHGQLRPGSQVRLRRADNAHPDYFRALLQKDDIVQAIVLQDTNEQAAWVAECIQRHIAEEHLLFEDILIVLSSAATAREDADHLMQALQVRGLASHLAGVASSKDELFRDQSIAICHIHRAKGNEAAMVYVVNAQEYMVATEQISRRNALFTALTRAKAWVRLSGWGSAMERLTEEFQAVKEHDYELEFTLLTQQELVRTRRLHRELTPEERQRQQKFVDSARVLLEAGHRDRTSLDALPDDMREALLDLLQNS